MSRRVISLAGLIVLAVATPARADPGGNETTSAESDSLTGAISAVAGLETNGGTGAAGASASRPRCAWERFDLGTTALPGAGVGPVIQNVTTQSIVSQPGQDTQTLYRRFCPGEAPAYVWVADGVSEADLLASALEQVTAQLPSPAMNVSPDPAVGGVVNIGLWMAVSDPGQVSITASVGPVWATVTARYDRTTWQMGNGDVVECPGLGTPISNPDTVEQGPCGYTYRWPSAPQFTSAGLAYQASVTGHWVITYATSSGDGGTLDPIARSTDFSYQVREIQTLRVADDG